MVCPSLGSDRTQHSESDSRLTHVPGAADAESTGSSYGRSFLPVTRATVTSDTYTYSYTTHTLLGRGHSKGTVTRQRHPGHTEEFRRPGLELYRGSQQNTHAHSAHPLSGTALAMAPPALRRGTRRLTCATQSLTVSTDHTLQRIHRRMRANRHKREGEGFVFAEQPPAG